MLLGIGVDLIDIEVFGRTLDSDPRTPDRMFTRDERAYCEGQSNAIRHYAGTAAVKEAVMKALGTGWTDDVDWLHIHIRRSDDGRPEVKLTDGAAARLAAVGATLCHASISHDGAYAIAFVVLEA